MDTTSQYKMNTDPKHTTKEFLKAKKWNDLKWQSQSRDLQHNRVCFSLPEDKTEGRTTHKQAVAKVSCSKSTPREATLHFVTAVASRPQGVTDCEIVCCVKYNPHIYQGKKNSGTGKILKIVSLSKHLWTWVYIKPSQRETEHDRERGVHVVTSSSSSSSCHHFTAVKRQRIYSLHLIAFCVAVETTAVLKQGASWDKAGVYRQ